MKIKRGDIVLANLEPVVGSEQGRKRPVLIIQNNIFNEHSPTTIIAPLSTKIYSKKYPTNVEIAPSESGLKIKSTILFNQIRTIDKSRIIKKISRLDEHIMKEVDMAIKISLSLL
ncbi:MAG: type II toxin-antitoxin system PemK/MazF family toxin [Nanoarchaeota archaeon]|nr:type II toxin-antitoxin system PemK/MazF family toxin [Nanoarchaeota archaeon]MBU1104043.1 type II toxin-antitoxin system PemK/MazF family toxin [Nanoarchaeota archaeon]